MEQVETGAKLRQLDLALEQARYEATLARRQYDAVDPDNRLVAGELERRWNERLEVVRAIEADREARPLAREPVWMPPSGAACLLLGPTLSAPGTARVRPPQPASASSAR